MHKAPICQVVFQKTPELKIVILIAKGKRDKKRGLSQFFVYLWRAIKHETLVKSGIRAEKRLVEGRVQQ